jgi:fructose/tagatose bisphosphate aldolase
MGENHGKYQPGQSDIKVKHLQKVSETVLVERDLLLQIYM